MTKNNPPQKERVKSLEKGLRILVLLSRSQSSLSLDEVTRISGFSKTSCFRILQTMKDLNFVEQNARDSTYRLGARNISLGAATLKHLSLRELAVPFMQRLQEQTRETINLTILDQTEVVFVERLEATHIISTHHHIGDRLPVYCTSMGKAILAFLPPARLDLLLEQIPMEVKTDQTIDSPEKLRIELERIRKTGLAVNNEELEKGLCAVAAPVLDSLGEPVAALNIAFPLIRYTFREAFDHYAPLVKHAAGEISKGLGYVKP